jgi:hypothetical protein
MEMMGLEPQEIEQHLETEPIVYEEELKSFEAAVRLQERGLLLKK